jgi:hypothetical protein
MPAFLMQKCEKGRHCCQSSIDGAGFVSLAYLEIHKLIHIAWTDFFNGAVPYHLHKQTEIASIISPCSCLGASHADPGNKSLDFCQHEEASSNRIYQLVFFGKTKSYCPRIGPRMREWAA